MTAANQPQQVWRDLAAEDNLDAWLRIPRRLVALTAALLATITFAAGLVTVPHREPLVPVAAEPAGVIALVSGGRTPEGLVGRRVTAKAGGVELTGRVVAVRTWAPAPGAPEREAVLVDLGATGPEQVASVLVDLGRRSLLADILARGGRS